MEYHFETIQAHSLSAEDCVHQFQTDINRGLTDEEVERRQEKYGRNELAEQPPTPLWKLVLEQFDDYLVQILLVSAVISFVLAFFEDGGEGGLTAFVEPFVILLILVLNAVVGVWQESNANSALTALKKMQSEKASVIRNGTSNPNLDASELVPGDIIRLKVGDRVPADCRILSLKTTTFRTEEGALTGESRTILKNPDECLAADCVISQKVNMVFSSTMVTNGICTCCVVRTGMETEIGKIQQAVIDAKDEEEKTPLSQKIDDFGEMLGKVILIICVVVWVMNFNQFSDPEFGGFFKGCIYYLKIAVALGVAAIPEGLPAVITLCLSLGTREMVKRNCIVRKLPSVETLGCTTVICSDKTGTLTTNEMSVVNATVFGAEGATMSYSVHGLTYSPLGEVEGIPTLLPSQKALCKMEEICVLCNESSIHYDEEQEKYQAVGEPTEASLMAFVEKLGLPDDEMNKRIHAQLSPKESTHYCSSRIASQYQVNGVLEFSRTRKSMSVLVSRRGESKVQNELLVKGAPELLLQRCSRLCTSNGTIVPLTPALRQACENHIMNMASNALRCLGFASKRVEGALKDYDGIHHPAHGLLTDTSNYERIEGDLTFYGVVGIKDQARPEVRASIDQCRQAGIRVFMITGDNKITAEAIARDVGILQPGEESLYSYEAREFMLLPRDQQIACLQGHGGRVFSRSEPIHKKQLIALLKDMGEITAMTGDGVNDAPALQQADIGVAMGISGTEVAKEASDMVLVDDNFSTIVAAIEEGRSIYQNMKAFIRYLISSNIGEVASIFFTSMLGIPENLSPVQLLWVNLVTDGLPATALGFNPPEPNSMQKPPRSRDESLITPFVFFRYMVIGLYVGFATVGVFAYWYVMDSTAGDGHPLVPMELLKNFHKCPSWTDFSVAEYTGKTFTNACEYFTEGKAKASTLSLTVLVTIEMFNALNALSEEASLLTMPPHRNPSLVLAILGSFAAHFLILYIPAIAKIFSVVPLTWHDWLIVLAFSLPVIVIDEGLKCVARYITKRNLLEREKKEKKEA